MVAGGVFVGGEVVGCGVVVGARVVGARVVVVGTSVVVSDGKRQEDPDFIKPALQAKGQLVLSLAIVPAPVNTPFGMAVHKLTEMQPTEHVRVI